LLLQLLFLFKHADGEVGKMARRLLDEIKCLWFFLEKQGVEPTNNLGERALRYGVI
jgi:transposase